MGALDEYFDQVETLTEKEQIQVVQMTLAMIKGFTKVIFFSR